MDSVTHFEIPVDDPKRASAFYSKVFGWQINQWGDQEYWLAGTAASDQNGTVTAVGAINGGLAPRKNLKAPTVTIKVANIEQALEWVAKSGGKVAAPKMPVGDMGFTAYFHDSEGNMIGLWQDAER